jgi:hypothetical protein
MTMIRRLQEVLLAAVLSDQKNEKIMKLRDCVLMGTDALRDYRISLKNKRSKYPDSCGGQPNPSLQVADG